MFYMDIEYRICTIRVTGTCIRLSSSHTYIRKDIKIKSFSKDFRRGNLAWSAQLTIMSYVCSVLHILIFCVLSS